MNELKLADLGEGMHEAEIVEWLVAAGESVRLDQPVVRVETDKSIVEIPSPIAGRVRELRFLPGQTANVGEVLLTFETSQASESRTRHAPGAPPSSGTPAPLAEGTASLSGRTETGRRVLAAPAVRKLAFELGIDLAAVSPSSTTRRISMEDVRAYAERASAAPAPRTQNILVHSPIQTPLTQRREPLTGLRKRIAEHMERSWRTIPHATAFDELNASGLMELRRLLVPIAEKRGVHLTYIPLLMKLLIPVLKAFPIFNASLDEETREIVYKESYHLGMATASPEGLLVPVLHDVDRLSVLQIARQMETLIAGAQKRTLAPNDLRGSTFTLNNVGSFGGSTGTPIINYPEVAILAVGKIEEKAVVCNGSIVVQARLPLALSFDHRLIDGALAGAFLAHFKELTEHPQQLLLDLS